MPSRRWALALPLTWGVLAPTPALAQAWSPEKGTVGFTLGFFSAWNTKHYFDDGAEIDSGHTRTQVLGLNVSIALTDRLVLSAGLPYVQGRYKGPFPHPGTIDNGEYHGTLTNFRSELRFQALEGPVALTPFVSGSWPTHDYTTLGHAAPGQGVYEYGLGFYAGQSLDPWIPRTYLQFRYGYTFAEEVAGIPHDRSNADLEVGYFLTEALGLRALFSWQDTYDGVTLPILKSDPRFPYHDAAAAVDFLNLGVGLSYSLTHEIDLYGIYSRSVRGKNGHKLDDGLSFGVAYGCHCAFRQVGEQIPQIRSRTP